MNLAIQVVISLIFTFLGITYMRKLENETYNPTLNEEKNKRMLLELMKKLKDIKNFAARKFLLRYMQIHQMECDRKECACQGMELVEILQYHKKKHKDGKEKLILFTKRLLKEEMEHNPSDKDLQYYFIYFNFHLMNNMWIIFFLNQLGLVERKPEDEFQISLLYRRVEQLIGQDSNEQKGNISTRKFVYIINQEKVFYSKIQLFLSLMQIVISIFQNFTYANSIFFNIIRLVYELNK